MGVTVGSIKWKLVLLYVILVVFVIIISGVYIVVNIQQSAYNDTYKAVSYTHLHDTNCIDIPPSP